MSTRVNGTANPSGGKMAASTTVCVKTPPQVSGDVLRSEFNLQICLLFYLNPVQTCNCNSFRVQIHYPKILLQ